MKKIIRSMIYCVLVFFSVPTWSSNVLESNEREKIPQSLTDFSILSNEIKIKIMQYKGVAKNLGGVCKDLEGLRCDKYVPLVTVIKNYEQFEKIHYFKAGIRFEIKPDNGIYERASKISNVDSIYGELVLTLIQDSSNANFIWKNSLKLNLSLSEFSNETCKVILSEPNLNESSSSMIKTISSITLRTTQIMDLFKLGSSNFLPPGLLSGEMKFVGNILNADMMLLCVYPEKYQEKYIKFSSPGW